MTWVQVNLKRVQTTVNGGQPFAAILFHLVSAVLGSSTYWLCVNGLMSDRLAFTCLTVTLLGYLAAQVMIVRHVHAERWLLNPAVLASFATLALGYGVTNTLFLMPGDELEVMGVSSEVSRSMVMMVALALAAAIAMWLGYWSGLPGTICATPLCQVIRLHLRPSAGDIRPFVVPVLVCASLFARLLQVQLGVFGYSGSPDQLSDLASTTQYLFIAGGLGKLGLALAALGYYRSGRRVSGGFQLWSVLGVEVVVGIFGGFKSAVVFPFVIVGVCRYLVIGSVSKGWIAGACIGLSVAYAVIEPFRAARDVDGSFSGTSVGSIIDKFGYSIDEAATNQTESRSLVLAVCARLNLAYPGSFGLTYVDQAGFADEDPAFLRNIVMAPMYAVVPRVLWKEKPLGTDGLWYYQTVMERPHYSSAAMGPVTYLFFAGGIVGVLGGFFCIGVLQRTLVDVLRPWSSIGGSIVYLGLLSTITLINSSIDAMIVNLIRELPLLLLIQRIVVARVDEYCHASAGLSGGQMDRFCADSGEGLMSAMRTTSSMRSG